MAGNDAFSAALARIKQEQEVPKKKRATVTRLTPPEPTDEPADTGIPPILPVSKVSDQFSDMRMAAIFSGMFKHILLYWADIKKWLIYDGRRWTTDAPGGAFPFVRQMLEDLYTRAMDCTDYAQRTATLEALMKLEAHPRQATILAAAQTIPELIVTAADLDQRPMLLTCHNGTIDLTTGILRPHSAADRLTRMVPIEYRQNALCPLFLKFLDRIFDGNQRIISYLQRYAGYCLTGRTGEQVLLFLYGLGCNGKSVLANILGMLLGDYSSTAGSDLLMARDNRSASNDIAALRGARLVKVSEFDDGERLAEAQIKTLTGGDPVTCRPLYCEFFTYVPTYKILLIGNHKPKIKGTDHGIWRRMHMINFSVTIPNEERDPYLQEKLAAEMPGILAWAVQGALDWQREGLNPSPEVLAAVDEYRRSEDVFDQWLEDCCKLGECFAASASALLASFIEYSKWRGTTPKKLGTMLAEKGFTREKSGVIKWRGLTLQHEDNSHWSTRNDDE